MGPVRLSSTSLASSLSYEEACAHLSDPFVERVVEQRHIMLPWQRAGSVYDAVKQVVHGCVGQYRSAINAIPLAIGKIRLRSPCYVIEDHACIHLDVSVEMIALVISDSERKRQRTPLSCTVSYVTKTSVVGHLYGVIRVLHSQPIAKLKRGDVFLAKLEGVQCAGSLCEIRTIPFTGNKRTRL